MLVGLQLVAQYIPDGPDAPDVEVSWVNGYTLTLTDSPNSNNAGQNYQEYIPALAGTPDPFWHFQGYLVFQVVSGFFPYAENYFDPNMARLIGQSDLADGITALFGVRHVLYVDSLGAVLLDTCYVESISGADGGLQFTYTVTEDAFTGVPFSPLDEVCFLVLAYGTNPMATDTACGSSDAILIGRKTATGTIRPICVNAVTAGLAEPEEAVSFSVWPVPADDRLLWTGTATPGRVRVLNSLGAEVYSSTQPATSGAIDVADLPVGTYMITFDDPRGGRRTRSFLVLR